MTSAVHWVFLMLGLYCVDIDATMTECQVRCPAGMVCTRVEGGNFHLCIRRSSLNATSQMHIDELDEDRQGEGEQLMEGRVQSPSLCPRPPSPPGPCVHQCRYHSDCQARQACCSNGCGYTCVSATPNKVTKPGSCPIVSRLDAEPCGPPCRTDADCTGRYKCCRSRCGAVCRAPCFHWLSNTRINPWRLSHRCRHGMSQYWE